MQHFRVESKVSCLEALATFAESEDIDGFIHRVRETYGVKHVTYMSFLKSRSGEVTPYLKTTYRPEWVGRYITMSYMSIDPVVENGFGRVLPFDWGDLDTSETPIRQLFGESIEFGVGRNGLTIPVLGDRTRGMLAITSDESPRDWNGRRAALIKDFQLIAGFLHVKAFADSPPSERTPLSRREIECLQWAALGKTDDEISGILGLSRLTISSYIKSARYKLGCINRVSAVAKAIKLHLIQP
ncbi:MAG TPA: LuxR family transcriptional regulator [Afifellaceae bacterium]|nr:LuxR family transcriptional regulator [Afifellaceae bacterium]